MQVGLQAAGTKPIWNLSRSFQIPSSGPGSERGWDHMAVAGSEPRPLRGQERSRGMSAVGTGHFHQDNTRPALTAAVVQATWTRGSRQ